MQNVDFAKLLRQEVPMVYVPQPFSVGAKAVNPNIELIDLNDEQYAQLTDEDYNSYFDNIAEMEDQAL